MNRLGQLLEAERAKRDLTLTDFARDVLGIDHSLVSRYVNGVQSPNRRTVRKIAAALSVPVADIDAMLAESDARRVMTSHAPRRGSLSADADADTPQLADVSFFGLVSELGTLTDAERASVLPVLREIVSRRRADRGGRGAGGRGGAAGP